MPLRTMPSVSSLRSLKDPLPGQVAVSKFYNSGHVQVCVALLIGANFLTNIVEKEIDPHGDLYVDVFGAFGLFYNVCFTIELIINLYAHWWKDFWASGWNVFDVVVVTIGVVNMIQLPLPPAFGMLRMMRAFRVFRLFKRVRSLNKIIVTIVHAIPGVSNAFLILFIVMSIYAILAVEFYYEIGSDCKQPGGDTRFRSARGYCFGQEFFGTFTKSLFTFFQVLTGESWSEAVARPAIWAFYDEPMKAVGGGLFFVSYILVSSFVLTNVVVAVLLDKMIDPETAATADARVPDDGEDGDDVTAKPSADGEEVVNVKQQNNAPSAEDLELTMLSVTSKVEELMGVSERMNTEMGSFRDEVSSMQTQLSAILQKVPLGAPVVASTDDDCRI